MELYKLFKLSILSGNVCDKTSLIPQAINSIYNDGHHTSNHPQVWYDSCSYGKKNLIKSFLLMTEVYIPEPNPWIYLVLN